MTEDPAVLEKPSSEPSTPDGEAAGTADADGEPPVMLASFPALASGLRWFDRRLGATGSVRSLRSCFGLALVFCWVSYFLAWGLGASGRIGDVRLLADPDQPARLLGALSAIAFPLAAMGIGRQLGRCERRAKLSLVRRWRRNPKQYRMRLRLQDFERRYRWLLGLLFGAALITALLWFRRGDVAAFAILFSWLALGPVSGIAVARRFSSPTSQGLAALVAGFSSISGAALLIMAFAGAGVSAFTFAILGVANIALTGAFGVLLELVMGGVSMLGLALAGTAVATVALALAGAGTGIATLTGVATMSRAGLAAFVILMSAAAVATLAFEEAAALSAAIGGIGALAVAAAISHNQMGHHGAYAGAIGAIALLTLAAVLLGWGDEPLVMFAVCFFFLLPLLIGLIAWLALTSMRACLLRLPGSVRGLPTASLAISACWAIGAFLTAALAFLLGYGVESYNQLTLFRSGEIAFAVTPMIERAVNDPFGEGLWLSSMILVPMLLPAILTASVLTDGLLALQPIDYRFRHALFWTLGAMLTLAAIAGVFALITGAESPDLAGVLGGLGLDGVTAAIASWSTLPR